MCENDRTVRVIDVCFGEKSNSENARLDNILFRNRFVDCILCCNECHLAERGSYVIPKNYARASDDNGIIIEQELEKLWVGCEHRQ